MKNKKVSIDCLGCEINIFRSYFNVLNSELRSTVCTDEVKNRKVVCVLIYLQ